VILFGAAAGLIQAAAQRAGLGLAAQHLLFDITRAPHHHLGDGRQFRDHFAGLGHLFQLADVLFQCGMVLAGGAVGIVAGFGKLVDRAFQPLHQLGQLRHILASAAAQHLFQPLCRQRQALLQLTVDGPHHLAVGAGQIIPADH
jgi:hypothetical protein